RKAQHEWNARVLFHHAADLTPFDLGAQPGLKLVAVDSRPPGGDAIDRHLEVLRAFVDARDRVRTSLDFLQYRRDALREGIQRGEIGPEDLDGHVTARTGEHLRDAHVD